MHSVVILTPLTHEQKNFPHLQQPTLPQLFPPHPHLPQALSANPNDLSNSFCLPRSTDAITAFLQHQLPVQGLLQHEIDEFIQFWVRELMSTSSAVTSSEMSSPGVMLSPDKQSCPFLLAQFLTSEELDKIAKLHTHPAPKQVIRVFCWFRYCAQDLTGLCGRKVGDGKMADGQGGAVVRCCEEGLVVEWGGTDTYFC